MDSLRHQSYLLLLGLLSNPEVPSPVDHAGHTRLRPAWPIE